MVEPTGDRCPRCRARLARTHDLLHEDGCPRQVTLAEPCSCQAPYPFDVVRRECPACGHQDQVLEE